MVGQLLLRGMIAGVVAGLLTFCFARIAGEPQVDQAIAFEESNAHAHHHHDGEADEPEQVSRQTQAGVGLLTGVVTYGAAFGGLFALTFALIYGRSSKLPARPLAAWMALAGFVALTIVPNLKYPANPPAVGDPDTIGLRTALFFGMIAISLVAMLVSLRARKAMAQTLGLWNASIAAGVLFIALIAIAQALLPDINEVPAAFPAVLLWKFRVAALGMQAIMWTTLGLLFGLMADHKMRELRAPALAH
ncbi:CbtA family protein [Amantichitinum ursilacus]|uniref:Putative cobalt transporter subunit (CbtA) n=1 Tax=Amantichitinum ursilacus TaxID=857265 RepID=A0A0N0XKL4_9NEIS|nr:CbtA family protein [Amantichitinum ursilacus]KPC52496.1 putative cobalt transporter subunit (CbtA) [Amantichitinum ursilacus]